MKPAPPVIRMRIVGISSRESDGYDSRTVSDARMDDVASVTIDAIVESIAHDGYAVVPHALPDALARRLLDSARLRDGRGEFVAAGTGRGRAHAVRSAIRGDRICWLDASNADDVEARWLAQIESLRCAINAALAIGLFEFEGHYAIYPHGAGYARHRDRFLDDDARVLSTIAYLNFDWTPSDGGELRLYTGERAIDVPPRAGTFVAFLSERFEHEVRATRRERYAFTGWFRRRG
jgi:SM-20-related protein